MVHIPSPMKMHDTGVSSKVVVPPTNKTQRNGVGWLVVSFLSVFVTWELQLRRPAGADLPDAMLPWRSDEIPVKVCPGGTLCGLGGSARHSSAGRPGARCWLVPGTKQAADVALGLTFSGLARLDGSPVYAPNAGLYPCNCFAA